MRRLLAVGIAGVLFLLLLPASAASAHPLGNFTVNTFTALRVGPGLVLVDHVTDRAEIPTQQLTFAGDPVAKASPVAQQQAWGGRACERVAKELTLVVDGRRVGLSARSDALRFPPGAGGLPTSRLTCRFSSTAITLHRGSTITYRDRSDGDRVGWHEIIASGDKSALTSSDVPSVSLSRALTRYPTDLLSSPLATKTATLVASPGGPAASDPLAGTDSPGKEQRRGVDGLTSAFTDLVGRHQLSIGVGLLAILLALVLGAFHAFAPGHGKTVMAAYLVADRGNLRQVSLIGLSVTATHTLGVLILGLLLSTFASFAPERVYPWLGIASGLLLLSIGVSLVRGAWDRRSRWTSPAPAHDHHHGEPGRHEHEHHDHDPQPGERQHEHGAHAHPRLVDLTDHPRAEADPLDNTELEEILLATGPPPGAGRGTPGSVLERSAQPLVHRHGGRLHSHAPITDEPIRLRNLLSMGLAGGLVPSPSALVVLVGAIALHRAWFGVILVVFYGAGMAVTLVGIGLLLSRLRGSFMRKLKPGGSLGRAFAVLPFGTASLICVIGAYLAVAGLLKI